MVFKIAQKAKEAIVFLNSGVCKICASKCFCHLPHFEGTSWQTNTATLLKSHQQATTRENSICF